jgi:ABC-type glycerol-3-phosphate transport system substrate-binding protein
MIGLCFTIILFFAMGSPVFASGRSSQTDAGGKRTVRVYVSWTESQLPNWPELVREYNSNPANPIRIDVQFFGEGGYDDKIRADLMTDPPEVFQLFKTGFNEYSAAGQLMELTGLFKDAGWYDIYNKGALAWAGPLTNPNNGIYGVPDFANTSCIFYNVKLFQQLGIAEPTDIPSLTTAAKKLNDNGIKAIVTGGNDWCAVDLFAKTQAQVAGTDILIKAYNGQAKYNDPSLVQALTIVNDLIKAKVIDPSSADYNDDEAIAAFVSGQAGMYTAHTAMTSPIDATAKSVSGFEYNIIKKINFVNNPKLAVPVTWGSMWCIPANCKDPEGAAIALKFLFGEQVARDTVAKVGKIYNVEAWDTGLTHPALKTAVQYQLPASATADSFYLLDMISSRVLDNLTKGIQEMIRGSVTPQEVLNNAQSAWETELAQRGR